MQIDSAVDLIVYKRAYLTPSEHMGLTAIGREIGKMIGSMQKNPSSF